MRGAKNDKKAARLAELARRREGNQALVLFPDEFRELGFFDVILKDGARTTLDAENFPDNDVLIIYPEDLGNV